MGPRGLALEESQSSRLTQRAHVEAIVVNSTRSQSAPPIKRDPIDSMEPVPLALCSPVAPAWQAVQKFSGDHV